MMSRLKNTTGRRPAGRARVAVLGGLAVAALAAATVAAGGQAYAANNAGTVTIPRGAGWHAAWNECQSVYGSQVHSVHYARAGSPGTEIWLCSRDR